MIERILSMKTELVAFLASFITIITLFQSAWDDFSPFFKKHQATQTALVPQSGKPIVTQQNVPPLPLASGSGGQQGSGSQKSAANSIGTSSAISKADPATIWFGIAKVIFGIPFLILAGIQSKDIVSRWRLRVTQDRLNDKIKKLIGNSNSVVGYTGDKNVAIKIKNECNLDEHSAIYYFGDSSHNDKSNLANNGVAHALSLSKRDWVSPNFIVNNPNDANAKVVYSWQKESDSLYQITKLVKDHPYSDIAAKFHAIFQSLSDWTDTLNKPVGYWNATVVVTSEDATEKVTQKSLVRISPGNGGRLNYIGYGLDEDGEYVKYFFYSKQAGYRSSQDVGYLIFHCEKDAVKVYERDGSTVHSDGERSNLGIVKFHVDGDKLSPAKGSFIDFHKEEPEKIKSLEFKLLQEHDGLDVYYNQAPDESRFSELKQAILERA